MIYRARVTRVERFEAYARETSAKRLNRNACRILCYQGRDVLGLSGEITPVLVECGSGFGYDFRISEVLKSQTDEEINRVFTIYFPDKEARQQFFAAESYKAIKAEFFESAVASTTLIAEYNREA